MNVKLKVYQHGRKLKDLLIELQKKFPSMDFPQFSKIVNGYGLPPAGFDMEVCRILDQWDLEKVQTGAR